MTGDRRAWIGGSDIAGILGIQPRKWRTAVQIWQRKTTASGEPPEEETPRHQRRLLARGKIIEPLVANMLETLYGIEGATRGKRYSDRTFPYFAAEIDLEVPLGAARQLFSELIDGDDASYEDVCNVEIKSVHPFAVAEWGEEGTDEVPIHYAAQVQWGLGVTCRRFALCAALFGADDLVLYPMIADEETIAGMRERANRFWTGHVLTGIPPPPQTLSDTALLWPSDDGSAVEADENIRGVLRTLQQMRAAKKSYEDGEEGVSLLIREYMKNASRIVSGDVELCTLKAQSRKSIDAELLKERFPEAAKAATRTTMTRVLRLAQEKAR